jgi:D-alanyl-D-alanine carboxypeptidase
MISPALGTATPGRPGPTVLAAAALPAPPRTAPPAQPVFAPPAQPVFAPPPATAAIPPVQVAALPPQQPVYAPSPYPTNPSYAPPRYAPPAYAAAQPVREYPVALPAAAQTGQWAIQVGAFSSPDVGQRALEHAVQTLPDIAGPAQRQVVGVDTASGRLYRARLVGLSPEAAGQACERLARGGGSCVALPPDRVY